MARVTPPTQQQNGWSMNFTTGDRSKSLVENEVISAIEYDRSGEFLATGNKGGQINVYAGKDSSHSDPTSDAPYTLYSSFQSHTAEFDYLRSLDIEEKINQIRWCRPSNNALYLISTNDKTVKLWKVHERSVWEVTRYNSPGSTASMGRATPVNIKLPEWHVLQHERTSTAKRIFANAHAYHINSIALNSDGETFISADDLRVNLWNLNYSDQSFTIVDVKPDNMEDLMEVITAADFHPSHCNVMMYSTSRGAIKLGDMRQAAVCDNNTIVFEDREQNEPRNFFSEIIASISDVKFSPDGRYILSRDCMTLKVWDINMDSRPVTTINIHEHLRSRLGDLYESDCIFDKFECDVSGDGSHFVTGSYNSQFHIYDSLGRSETCISPNPRTASSSRRHSLPQGILAPQAVAAPAQMPEQAPLDLTRKIMQARWHPLRKEVAVAVRNSLCVYNA